MGLFSSVFGGNASQFSNNNYQGYQQIQGCGVNLDSVKSLLETKIDILKYNSLNERDFAGSSSEVRDLVSIGVDAKRRGDLVSANRYYCESFKRSETFDSSFVWGWCKIMILAKNWECLRDLIEYHFDIMVVYNRLMKERGNQTFFDNYERFDMIPYFEFSDFHAGEAIRDKIHSPLMNRSESIARLSEFGGSPYWQQNYYISESEWIDFMRVFPLPEI